ncbi:MAG: GntR family transcriptional regulator [Planctomycetota bacterium]
MSFRVDTTSTTPPSRQIVEAILDRVAAGEIAAGDRVPSVRQMAELALVNPNTVSRAYRELEWLGVVEGRNGTGVFVTSAGPRLARKQRAEATLAAFVAAAKEALRAGHDPVALQQAFDALATTPAQGGEPR